jgi:hypothetical protein
MPAHYVATFDPVLSSDGAAAMVELCERFGSYGMYSEEPTFTGLGEGLPARWDAVRNFLKTGGRFRREEPLEVLAARTNYFRETYAYGARPAIAGIEPFLFHEGFVEAARALHGRPVIEPAIVFANLLVPGQELAVHTDVPEFRGVNRKRHPQWLIVAMGHSGLFESWRMPIATGVAWFHDCRGGEFAFYPDGAQHAPRAHSVRYNTALLLDTDSVFHGVDRVAETGDPIAPLRPGMRLCFVGDRRWEVRDGERVVARYRWEDLRFSVSWKAYCFADEAERDAWAAHGDDLSVDVVVERLMADMRSRGVIGTEAPAGQELVDLIIDTYVHYPPPTSR